MTLDRNTDLAIDRDELVSESGYVTARMLRRALEDVPDDAMIILSKDGEGNEYSPLADATADLYDAVSTWSGDRYMTDQQRMDTGEPEEYREAPEAAVPVVTLWPTN